MNPVTYTDSDHVYLDAHGKRLPSVTTIIREVFQTGSFGHSPESRFRGEAVHRACQLISEGRYVEERVHEVVRPFARGWKGYVADCRYVSSYWEIPMASRYGFAGRPDTWGVSGPAFDPTLVDAKTGSLPLSVALQFPAYDMLIRENFPGTPRMKRRAVQLQADGRYTVHSGVNIPGNGFMPFDDSRWDNLWAAALSVYASGLLKVAEI